MIPTNDVFKRVKAFALALILFCGFLAASFFTPETKPIAVHADSWTENNNQASGFYSDGKHQDGDGSIERPFWISSAAELALMAYNINNKATNLKNYSTRPSAIPFAEAFYKFAYTGEKSAGGNDGIIKLGGHDFEPIGTIKTGVFNTDYNSDDVAFDSTLSLPYVFQGHFNGEYLDGENERQFLKIENLTGKGLFGATDSAHIRNFDLINAQVSNNGHCGAVVNVGIDTEVRNVSVDSESTVTSTIEGGAAGGIMGYGVRSSVFACENYAAVTAAVIPSGPVTIDNISKAGGMAGAMVKGGLGDCINQGVVTGYCAGGIMGYAMQASINRTINSAPVIGKGATIDDYSGENDNEPIGEFIGAFNTKTAANPLDIVESFWPTPTYLQDDPTPYDIEAGALIKDSFYNTDFPKLFDSQTPSATKLVGVHNDDKAVGAADYTKTVKALDTVHMTGRMMQKLNMSNWQDKGIENKDSADLLFWKWWSYSDDGLPRPIKWEMWVDSAEMIETTTINSVAYYTPKSPGQLAYCAYMINRGLWDETVQKKAIKLYAGSGIGDYKYGNIDLGEKLWIPFGTVKNPYMGETFNITPVISNVSYTQAFIASMTINSALSYQSFFGVVKQPTSTKTLKVNDIHLAGMDVWGGSVDQTAGFVSLYIYHDVNQIAYTPSPNNLPQYQASINKYYQFTNCVTSGDISSYGNAVGITTGYSDLQDNTTIDTYIRAIWASFKPYIIFQSGNATNIISFAGNACGLVYSFSNIISKFGPVSGADVHYGITHCFNTGKISALRNGGIASGLISYVNAANQMAISNCYNAGELNGYVKANYAGDINGNAVCSFNNSYYRDDSGYFAANRTNGSGTTTVGIPLPVTSMQGAVAVNSMSLLTSTYWGANYLNGIGILYNCNNGCIIGNDSINFYKISLTVNNKHDGDVVASAKVVQRMNENNSFTCTGLILKAYPIRNNNNDFPTWTQSPSVTPTGQQQTITIYGNEQNAGLLYNQCDFTAIFKPISSVAVVSENPEIGSISAGLGASSYPENYSSVVNDGKTNPYMFTYIFPTPISSTDFTLTADDQSEFYEFVDWGDVEPVGVGGVDQVDPLLYKISFPLASPYTDTRDILLKANFTKKNPKFYLTTKFYIYFSQSMNGSAQSSQSEYQENDVAVLRAYPDKGYKFAGWYDASGALVSKDSVYSFTVVRNETFTPRFVKETNPRGIIFATLGGLFFLTSLVFFVVYFDRQKSIHVVKS